MATSNDDDAEHIKRSRLITDEIMGFLESQYPDNVFTSEVGVALSCAAARLAVHGKMPPHEFLKACDFAWQSEFHRFWARKLGADNVHKPR